MVLTLLERTSNAADVTSGSAARDCNPRVLTAVSLPVGRRVVMKFCPRDPSRSRRVTRSVKALKAARRARVRGRGQPVVGGLRPARSRGRRCCWQTLGIAGLPPDSWIGADLGPAEPVTAPVSPNTAASGLPRPRSVGAVALAETLAFGLSPSLPGAGGGRPAAGLTLGAATRAGNKGPAVPSWAVMGQTVTQAVC